MGFNLPSYHDITSSELERICDVVKKMILKNKMNILLLVDGDVGNRICEWLLQNYISDVELMYY